MAVVMDQIISNRVTTSTTTVRELPLSTHRRNSRIALVEVGMLPSGQERKWNWVTVRVSPVWLFLR